MPLSSYTTILNGKYRILNPIGEGAMARVWLAEELTFGRRYLAIKEPTAAGDSTEGVLARERFLREVKLSAVLAQANSPNIVQAITAEPYDGSLLLVLTYMAGGDLKRLLQSYPQGLPLDRIYRLLGDIVSALAAVHSHPIEIVHRDIKPSNILFDQKGKAYLGDFGVAQVGDWSSDQSHLEGRMHPGTPHYMAPEQASSANYLTPAADIYAFGCVIFEMLTGQKYKRVRPGTKAIDIRPDTPEWMDEILAKTLSSDPWERWQNGRELAEALGDNIANIILVQPEESDFTIPVMTSTPPPDIALGTKESIVVENPEDSQTGSSTAFAETSPTEKDDLTSDENEKIEPVTKRRGRRPSIVLLFMAALLAVSSIGVAVMALQRGEAIPETGRETLISQPDQSLETADNNGAEPATAPTEAVVAPVVPTATPTASPQPTSTPTAVFTPTPTPSPTPPAIARVTSASLNLRNGPGSQFSVIQEFPNGSELIILGKSQNDDWLNVRSQDNAEGWMATSYLGFDVDLDAIPVKEVTPVPTPSRTATPTKAPVVRTATPTQPVLTPASSKQTPLPSTNTPVPPTLTPRPTTPRPVSTNTPVPQPTTPATPTTIPPTNTPAAPPPPTNTPAAPPPSTNTPVPTWTPKPWPTSVPTLPPYP